MRLGSTAVRLCSAGVAAALALGVSPSAANAGQWIQVSCQNPSGGSSAPSQGWTTTSGGGPTAGSSVSADCTAGSPMFGIIPAASPGGSYEMLVYTPPAGSTLTGGTIDVLLDGDGGGPSGDAVVYEPTFVYPNSVIAQCADSLPTDCYEAAGPFSGAVSLPSNAGGNLYVEASCSDAQGPQADCTPQGPNNDVSQVDVYSAELTLANSSSPGGSGFNGTATQSSVSGTPHLLFTATDPNGPGVYHDCHIA